MTFCQYSYWDLPEPCPNEAETTINPPTVGALDVCNDCAKEYKEKWVK